jgi:ATP-dependent NAD(P)H-hydrate dehydratase
MSNAEIVQICKSIVPTLSHKLHKGQAGRVGILGGSDDYTGAPYFSAMAALKMGTDLVHVFCASRAANAIKSYSPELMVHPYLETTDSAKEMSGDVVELCAKRVIEVFPRLHVLVVGPGLGRDDLMLKIAKKVVMEARIAGLPLVIDADGLYLVQMEPTIIHGYRRAILTPNVNEFKRLCEAQSIDATSHELAISMGNVTILEKGVIDNISNGELTIQCDENGSPRRCGGQGDVLSGCVAAWLAWTRAAEKETGNASVQHGTVYASYAAAHLTRVCANLAFSRKARSMTTTDLLDALPAAFWTVFETDTLAKQHGSNI